tara:strand:- start:476 stop:1078 length:603 start_codon:yes stop_codon:yes gene_type:complete
MTRPAKTLSSFKSALIGGGVRPNLFEVQLTTVPDGVTWSAESMSFMCKAAQIPASNIASVDVPFRGRILKVAGDRTVDNWTVTIINDENMQLRRGFEMWVEHMARLDNNVGATNPAAYMMQATVFQLGRGGARNSTDNNGEEQVILAEYQFRDIFPVNVSPIELSFDSSDTIEEYTVEFAVNSIVNPNTSGPTPEPEDEE